MIRKSQRRRSPRRSVKPPTSGHHPRPTLPKHNQGEHLTIPGVDRYWMLITPRAGSLFHAVFQVTRRPRVQWALSASRATLSDVIRDVAKVWVVRIHCSTRGGQAQGRRTVPTKPLIDDCALLLEVKGGPG